LKKGPQAKFKGRNVLSPQNFGRSRTTKLAGEGKKDTNANESKSKEAAKNIPRIKIDAPGRTNELEKHRRRGGGKRGKRRFRAREAYWKQMHHTNLPFLMEVRWEYSKTLGEEKATPMKKKS